MVGAPLVCPRCGELQPDSERFCPRCRVPLTYADASEPVPTAAQEHLRKVKPQYAEGDLVRVAGGRNQAEADFIAGLLLEEGIPSLVRRSRGFDVPEMLAAGPRDVLVPQSGVVAAREVLLEADLVPEPGPELRPARLFAAVSLAVAAAGLVVWVGTELAA